MPNLFLDSDGVIFDFDRHVMSHSGGVHPRTLGDDPLWNLINAIPDFWITMPLLPWAHDLVQFCKPYSPTILTGCPRSNYEYAADQKQAKYAKHFPDLKVITCLSRNKPTYMKATGDVLVDDTYKNIKRWIAADGVGIFFRNYHQTVDELRTIFK